MESRSRWLREEGSALNAGIPTCVWYRPRPRLDLAYLSAHVLPTRVKIVATPLPPRASVLMSEGAIAWLTRPLTNSGPHMTPPGVNERWTTMSNRSSLIHPNDQTTRQSSRVDSPFYRESSQCSILRTMKF